LALPLAVPAGALHPLGCGPWPGSNNGEVIVRKALLLVAALLTSLAVVPDASAGVIENQPWTGTIIISNATVQYQDIPDGWTCRLTNYSPYEVTCEGSGEGYSVSCPMMEVTATTSPGAAQGEVACDGNKLTTRPLLGYDADAKVGGLGSYIRRVYCRAYGIYGSSNPLGTFSVTCLPDPGLPPL
jgi:hypothetical protein